MTRCTLPCLLARWRGAGAQLLTSNLCEQVVGVAFQSLVNAENMGFIIPVPIIKHFLKDIELHGKYTVLAPKRRSFSSAPLHSPFPKF